MEGPRALHFPKFPENFPQFSNPKKLFSFLKCWSFKFFFWILIRRINFNSQEMKKTTYGFSPQKFSKIFRGQKIFFRKCSRTFIILLWVDKQIFSLIVKYFSKNLNLKIRFRISQIFQVKHFFGRDTFFEGETVFGRQFFERTVFFGGEINTLCSFTFQFWNLPFLYSFWCYETITQKLNKIPYNLSQCGNYDVRDFFSRRFLFMRFLK